MKISYKKISIIVSLGILIFACYFVYHMYKIGVLSNEDSLKEYIESFGILAPLIFIMIQINQAVMPIIPLGINSLAGVVLFGPIFGFVYNYIGICVGSMLGFYIGRHAGRTFIEKIFSEKLIHKYDKYMSDEKKFIKFFTIMVIIPAAPDDLLCYLAGTTNMTKKRFNTIILLGKIPSILMYSLGVYYIIEKLVFG